MPYFTWTQTVIGLIFTGVSPCLTAFLDIFDILNVVSLFELPYTSHLVLIIKAAIILIISIFDCHYCNQSFVDGN